MIKELDEVFIPEDIAKTEGVVQHGTVVWYNYGAEFATVECEILSNNPDRLKSKLIDVDIERLTLK